MKATIKFIALFTGFLFSLFPTMAAFIYLLSGKQAFIDFITGISSERFWLFGIPLFIVTMTASVLTLMEMMYFKSPAKQAKPLSVDDPDLEKKIKRLNMLETQY
jgi:hypothetical protein